MPVIETPRLQLRQRIRADIEEIVALDSDCEVRRFRGGPLDPASHRAEVSANIADVPPRHRTWIIEYTGQPGFVGLCTLRPQDKLSHDCVGWRLHRFHWGQGIATEASRAVLRFELSANEAIAAVIDPRNMASIGVARKLGMKQCDSINLHGTEQLVFHVTSIELI